MFVALLGAFLLLLSSIAWAAGEIEPNNDIIYSQGPIGSTSYQGHLGASDEDDWYWVQLAGGQQISFSAVFEEQGCFFPDADARLIDYSGKVLLNLSGPTFEPGVVQEDHYTTPPNAQTYFVEVEHGGEDEDCAYSFQIGPAAAFAPAPPKPPLLPLSEPDDLVAEAHEIGAGTLYTGKIDTSNDVERLFFIAKAQQSVAVEIAGGDCGGRIEAGVAPPKNSGTFPETAYGSTDSWGRAVVKTGSGGRFDVTVSGDTGCTWQLLLSPASALGADAPSNTHVDPCRKARRLLTRRRARLHRLQRTLSFASPRRRPHIRHQIAARRRAVKSARRAVQVRCGGKS
jgi:hypothetical protein